jgi:hypothetical protein
VVQAVVFRRPAFSGIIGKDARRTIPRGMSNNGSTTIRRTMLPNNRRVRWLSTSINQ